MTDRHIYFIVTERNIEKIKKTLKFNSILINEFTKNFKKIYILNLFNLKLYEKKIKFNYSLDPILPWAIKVVISLTLKCTLIYPSKFNKSP